MIHITKRLSFAFLLAAGLGAGGCYGTVGYHVRVPAPTVGVYVESAPPAPRVEYYEPRPGWLWISGRWNWSGGQWVWMGGHWERERVGYYWQPGRWDNRGGHYYWVEGNWAAGQGRDHRGPEWREERREERQERRDDARDHRQERREERREDRREDRDHRH